LLTVPVGAAKGVVMKGFLIAGTAIALAGMVGAAAAADGLGDMTGRSNWTGFYAGVNAGYAWGSDTVSLQETAPGAQPVDLAAVGAAGSPSFSPDGFVGGAQAGYNYQFGDVVFGFETDFQYLGLRGALGISSAFPSAPSVPYNVNTSVSTNWLFTARPRLGYVLNKNLMLYATGGLAVADDRFSQTAGLARGFTVSSSSQSRIGGVVGAGVEWAMNERWSAKAEYLWADFGSVDTLGTLTPQFSGFEWHNSYHLTTSIARVGVNYRFW
jgi:outer membrane immunogenic protein